MIIRKRLTLVTLTSLVFVIAPPAHAQGRTLIAIVNRGRPEAGLTRQELVQMYRGDLLYWPSSRQRVRLALPPSPQLQEEFLRRLLKMSRDDYSREWLSKRFNAVGVVEPNPNVTPTEVMQAVLNNRQVIAIVDFDWFRNIDKSITQSVKILQIDGKTPEAADYPLRLTMLFRSNGLLRYLAE
jgi:hypothetical protein